MFQIYPLQKLIIYPLQKLIIFLKMLCLTLRKEISRLHLRITTELGINLMHHYEKVLIWFLITYLTGYLIKIGIFTVITTIKYFTK
ncbi:hypothetical protein M153_4050006099 [Pseudoloma neurophilia]|uniref:Uncharacterized protein n=1 Tax=Pseudoloma neurophilia TaxID=146866 RepID=A0A0R0LXJ1_9MICR|nr:hypothetical protein M153_4050006099 [Pseudoloma neurophilia]